MIAWLRRAWLWVSLALGLAVVALFSLWRKSARQVALERERAEAAAESAAREREVADKIRVIEAKAEDRRKAAGALLAERRVEAAAVETQLRAEVAETGSAADEVNRRMDNRGGQ